MKIGLFNGMKEANSIEDMIINNLPKEKLKHLKLRDMDVNYCRCCGVCSKTSKCVQKDDGVEVLQTYQKCDIIIYLTNIKYGAYSKELKKAIDRTLPIGDDLLLMKEGYMIHKIIYNNKKVLVIGVLEKESEKEEKSFRALVKANYYNMDWKSYKEGIIYENSPDEEQEEKIKNLLKEIISYE